VLFVNIVEKVIRGIRKKWRRKNRWLKYDPSSIDCNWAESNKHHSVYRALKSIILRVFTVGKKSPWEDPLSLIKGI
jgi:hypothetical protein